MATKRTPTQDKKEDLRVSLARNLKAARSQFDMTQASVAELFDPPLSRAAVAQWEVGDTLPDVDRLVVLAKAYNCSLNKLVFGDDHVGHASAKELSPDAVKLARCWMSKSKKERGAFFVLLVNS